MVFIGHTRYSLFNPRSASWRATNGIHFRSEDEYKKYLYSDERMDLREGIFLKESLPLLALASDGFIYKHVISFSDSLPEKRKEALRQASEKYSFIILDEHSTDSVPVNLHHLAQELIGISGTYGIFRLDDDDVLSVNFFKNAAKYIDPSFAGMQVSFPRGIEALWGIDEISFMRDSYFPMLALGLLSICERQEDGSLIAPEPAPHTLSDRFNPVVQDAREIAYVRYNHLTQDTALNAGKIVSFRDIVNKLLKYPELSVDSYIEDLFPTLKHRFTDWLEYMLFKGDTIVSSDMYLPFPSHTSSFRISLDVTYAPESQPNSALVKLDLRDEDGREIDPQVKIPDIGTSPNPNIAHYKYLRTEPGRKILNENIILPPTIKCHGIALRAWGRHALPFVLHEVKFRVLKS